MSGLAWTERMLAMPGTTECRECGEQHFAEFSHISQYGENVRVYSVVCPKDANWLTDYYTDEVVEVRSNRVIATRSTKALALKYGARLCGLPEEWHDDTHWDGQKSHPVRVRWFVKRITATGKYEVIREVQYV